MSTSPLAGIEEEMGIDRSDVTILGELDEVVTRSHFKVNVYVGTIPYPYPFKPSAAEIAEVLGLKGRFPCLEEPEIPKTVIRWIQRCGRPKRKWVSTGPT